jgi:acetolactate synthase I/III small subunit
MRHVISLLVENHQGVLSRISGLFSGRGYNLDSITSGPTVDPSVARITLVCKGDDQVIDQIKKQLNRLVDTIKVIDLTESPTVDRELVLIKIGVPSARRSEIMEIAQVFKAKILDLGYDSLLLEITGSSEKIDDIVQILQDYPILEIARSGLVSMERAKKTRH